MTDKDLIKLSKYMSLILRHSPETGNITLDNNGWTTINSVLKAAKDKGYAANRSAIETVVRENDKKRFEIKGDNIRACQGHSVKVDLDLKPSEPPEYLYHGTATKNIGSIYNNGINSGNRQHVHLSTDIETATKVGSRHGTPFIFKINSKDMHQDGYIFYISNNGVWLTETVPPVYLASA